MFLLVMAYPSCSGQMAVKWLLLLFHLNYLKDVIYSDLSTKLVESIVNEELCATGQVTVGIGSGDSSEYNSRRRSLVVWTIVVLCLVNSHNSLECHQHQNNDVVLAQAQNTCCELLLDMIPTTIQI